MWPTLATRLLRSLQDLVATKLLAIPPFSPRVHPWYRAMSHPTLVWTCVQVATSVLPEEVLRVQAPVMCEGLLVWADDSKNRFRANIRSIVERLVRRLGEDAVREMMPDADEKLLKAIRKRKNRAERRKAGVGWGLGRGRAAHLQVPGTQAELRITRTRAAHVLYAVHVAPVLRVWYIISATTLSVHDLMN